MFILKLHLSFYFTIDAWHFFDSNILYTKKLLIQWNPVMKVKIENYELAIEDDAPVPDYLPKLDCDVLSIVREYFVDGLHLGYGFETMNRRNKGFFNMLTCYSGDA